MAGKDRDVLFRTHLAILRLEILCGCSTGQCMANVDTAVAMWDRRLVDGLCSVVYGFLGLWWLAAGFSWGMAAGYVWGMSGYY